MRRILPLIGLFVAACSADAGQWPSLARRPGEAAPMVPRPAAGGAAADPLPAAAAPPVVAAAPPAAGATPIDTSDVTATLSTVARDLDDVAVRSRAQRDAFTAATTRARAAAAGSEAAGTVELERTRLDRIGGQIGDLRDRLDAVAGTLAEASAAGADVAAQTKTTGTLIARTRALASENDAAVGPARASETPRRTN